MRTWPASDSVEATVFKNFCRGGLCSSESWEAGGQKTARLGIFYTVSQKICIERIHGKQQM